MYVPKHFAIEDRAWVRAFVRSHNFGTLISRHEGELFATHLPFMLDDEPAPNGTLRAHMARENPQWRSFGEEPVLAIFAGPHGYVSPSLYESNLPKVPTWNYVAVHIYGTPRRIDDLGDVEALLRKLIVQEEAGAADPWTYERVDEPYRKSAIHHIVAFEIPIVRIEAKAKLSQNRPAADQRNVAGALGGELAEAMRDLVLG